MGLYRKSSDFIEDEDFQSFLKIYPWMLFNGAENNERVDFSLNFQQLNCDQFLTFSYWLANMAKPERQERLPWWKAILFVESVLESKCIDNGNLLENICTMFLRLYMNRQGELSEINIPLLLKFCIKCISSGRVHDQESGMELAQIVFFYHQNINNTPIGKYFLNKISTLEFEKGSLANDCQNSIIDMGKFTNT